MRKERGRETGRQNALEVVAAVAGMAGGGGERARRAGAEEARVWRVMSDGGGARVRERRHVGERGGGAAGRPRGGEAGGRGARRRRRRWRRHEAGRSAVERKLCALAWAEAHGLHGGGVERRSRGQSRTQMGRDGMG